MFTWWLVLICVMTLCTFDGLCIESRNYRHTTAEVQLTDQVMLAPRDCAPDETPIFIHTSAVTSGKYYDRRMIVRRTWGQEAPQYKMRLFFVFGVPSDRTIQRALEDELAQYRDVLQFNFTEAYFNLTLKAIAELKWAARHCNASSYMVKVDDDVVMNIAMLSELVHKKMIPPGLTGLQYTAHAVARRDPNHKWYFPSHVYIDDTYEYLMGFGYVLSMDRIKQMVNAIGTYPGLIIDIDDMYITGLIADHGRVERNNSYRFRLLCSLDLCAMERSLMTHGCDDPKKSEQLYRLWKQADTRRCQDIPLIRHKARGKARVTRTRRSTATLDLLVFY